MTNLYDLNEKEKPKYTGTLFDICEGDSGTIGFLASACSYPDRAFNRMKDNGITGHDLYTLYHVCCGDDVAKALYVMLNNDIDIIKDCISNGTSAE